MTGTDRVPTAEASTSQLITQATEDISRLVRDELQMAKRDVAQSGKKLGIGAGLFGAAGTLSLYGLAALVAAAILGLANAVDPWLAAIIVAVALFAAAAVAGLVAKGSVSHVADGPHERATSVKDDIDAVKGQHPQVRA